MKKIKLINLINYISIIVVAVIDLILAFVFKLDFRFYYSTVLCLAISGLLNLGFILIKELAVLEYDSKRFYPIMFGAHIFIGVFAYYLIENLKSFNEYWYLYWIGLFLGFILPIVIVHLLEIKAKKNKKTNKPKFVVNRH